MGVIKKAGRKKVHAICPVILLLDTSGSMGWPEDDPPIKYVNEAIRGVLQYLFEANKTGAAKEVDFKVAILTFDTKAEWATGSDDLVNPSQYFEKDPNDPEAPEKCTWQDLEAGGYTQIGDAFAKLEAKLHNGLATDGSGNSFINGVAGNTAPVIFLLSDGEPTDPESYPASLDKLKENKWYKVAVTASVGYGPECDDKVLKEFLNDKDYSAKEVIHSNDPKELSASIKKIVIRSSQVASQTV